MTKNISTKNIKVLEQVYNPATGNIISKDSLSGKLIILKSSKTSPKVLRNKKIVILSNPSVSKNIALKAEKAVVAVMNSK